MMSTEPGVFFPGKWLQWLTPSANGMPMIPVVRGALSLLLAMAMVVLAAGNALSDHSVQPSSTFVFTGSPIASTPDMQNFTISNDGALYFKLKSATPAGTPTNPITVGFMTTTNPNTCSDRYISHITNPVVGQTYGPYYMEAGTYRSYYYHLGVATTSYELDIEFHRQLTPNDTEPNDSMQTPWDIGNVTLNIPYHPVTSAIWAVIRTRRITFVLVCFLPETIGSISIMMPTFSDKPGCKVYTHFYDETAGSWLNPLSHTGPPDAAALGPVAFYARP